MRYNVPLTELQAELGLTDKHLSNLRTLRDHLWCIPSTAPSFDMAFFGDSVSPRYGMGECGSAGCAVGHATFCLERRRPSDYGPLGLESWGNYAERMFGLEFCRDADAASWLFSASWEDTDNTPIGAAQRIHWLLEKGLPKDWDKQMRRAKPLCYTNLTSEEYVQVSDHPRLPDRRADRPSFETEEGPGHLCAGHSTQLG